MVIAMAGAYVAGGTPLDIGFAAVFGEAFFERLWQLIISVGLDTGAQDAGRRRRLKKRWFGMAAPAGNELAGGQRLPEQHWLQSGNRRYLLIMWRGQLAIWGPDDSVPVWSTGTDGSDAKYAELNASGRLGLYSADGALAAWQSPVPGGGATLVRLEDDGALAAYRADGTKVWATLAPQVPADRLIFNFGVSADLAGEA